LNDFGEEIRVEREMINDREGGALVEEWVELANGALVEEWVELANGCVCCTVKHSLVQALEQLVQMKGRFCYFLNSLINAFDLPSPVSIV
jgi:G3E family GTPase